MGNPFINAVYIGHPGWKAMGGRIGYSAAIGVMVIVLCWLGTIPAMIALIPSVAIVPILLYIGMLIGSQAFQETPRSHAPAIVLALIPNLAAWALSQINGALSAAGMAVGGLSHDQLEQLTAKLKNEGVLYHGLQVLGGGAILGGLILGAMAVCAIDRNFKKAAGFSFAGAVLTFFGFMHGEQIGIGQTPVVAISYLAVAAVFLSCAKIAVPVPQTHEILPESGQEHLPA